MIPYRAYIDSLPDKLFKDSVRYYEKDRLVNVYQGFFDFALTDLSRKDRWKEWDVARCGFFFRREAKNDAKAIRWGNDIWIEINDHLFESLFKRFEENKYNLASLVEARILKRSHPKDELYYFMFTTATIFLYYHELAHIIQYDINSEMQVTKEMNAAAKGDKFDIDRHALEYDSDEFAANFLYEQIAGNFVNRAKIKSKDVLMAMITTSVVAVFALFDTFDGGFKLPVYFEEKTHPNSIIRVIAITGLLLDKMRAQFGSKYQITQPDVIKRSFEIIVPLLGPGNSFDNFYKAISLEKANIVNYSGKLRKYRDQFSWMAGVRLKKKYRKS